MHSHGGDDGTAILLYGDTFGFNRARRDQLWHSAWKWLAPQMAMLVQGGREIHPRAIRGPADRCARSWGPYGAHVEAAVEGNQAAARPLPVFVHLDHQGCPVVGRDRGIVCH